MATGDAATAAGMSIMTGNEPANTLDTEINLTRDYIAQRTATVTPIAKGGTGATTAAAARAALGAAASVHTHTKSQVTDLQTDLNYLASSKASVADVQFVQDGNMSSNVYNRTLGGQYRVLYVNSAGLIGWVSSSRRQKKNIKPASVDPAAVLGLQLVTFLYKAMPDDLGRGELQHGLIAEDVDALGLTWLVDYGAEGQPEGIRYDRLALALLPVIQQQAARLADLEARLTALETRDDSE